MFSCDEELSIWEYLTFLFLFIIICLITLLCWVTSVLHSPRNRNLCCSRNMQRPSSSNLTRQRLVMNDQNYPEDIESEISTITDGNSQGLSISESSGRQCNVNDTRSDISVSEPPSYTSLYGFNTI